eukprot:11972615-Karenia_brevis.AAC.1
MRPSQRLGRTACGSLHREHDQLQRGHLSEREGQPAETCMVGGISPTAAISSYRKGGMLCLCDQLPCGHLSKRGG